VVTAQEQTLESSAADFLLQLTYYQSLNFEMSSTIQRPDLLLTTLSAGQHPVIQMTHSILSCDAPSLPSPAKLASDVLLRLQCLRLDRVLSSYRRSKYHNHTPL